MQLLHHRREHRCTSSSKSIETLKKKGREVLHVSDPIHEYAVQQLEEFNGRRRSLSPKRVSSQASASLLVLFSHRVIEEERQ
jgi:HSP90 family molecular chaperone